LNVAASVSKSAWIRPFAVGARLSTYRAMCPCTTFAVAVTVLKDEQSILAHKLNVRELPTVGGPASSSADGAAAPAPACGANPYHRNRSACRRKSWNC